jgi:hypothetical protein
MIDIPSYSAAVQYTLAKERSDVSLKGIKRAADADQALADMLEKNSETLVQTTQPRKGSRVSIYV